MSKVCGFGDFDDVTLKKHVSKYNKFVEKSENRFNILKNEDKDALRTYILKSIKKLAKNGISSFEYQTDTNLERRYSELFTVLKTLGLKYSFYRLSEEYSNKKYNLTISWYN